MFSRRTSGRFPREQGADIAPGPGSYNLPSTLDKKAPAVDGQERFSETSVGGDLATPCSPVPSFSLKGSLEKENQAPLRQSQKSSAGNLSARASSTTTLTSEAKQQHRQDIKLQSQIECTREQLKTMSRETKEQRLQLAAKDRKVDELQKKVEELASQKREAYRHTLEIEGERDLKRRQLHEKDQEVTTLQRKVEHLRAAGEERGRRAERAEEAMQAATAEAVRFRDTAEAQQDKLATAERDRRCMDTTLRQQQRQSQEYAQGMKEHVEVLEESLRREESRRRELEELAARSGAEQEHGEAELVAERRQVQELQRHVKHLEAEARSRLAQVEEWGRERERLEGDLVATRARIAAQDSTVARAEDRRQELETRAARAEVALEAQVRDLRREGQRVAELEAEVRGEQEARQAELRAQAADAESRLAAIVRDLEDERQRSEELERRVASHEDRERVLAASASCATPRQESPDQRASELQDKLEAAEEEAQRLREWLDEQSLRELTAETQRLEEIKRVREDVGAQVEAAKQEVLNENNTLQVRIRELEKGPEGTVQIKVRLIEFEKKLGDQAEALSSAETERDRLRLQSEQASKEMSSLRRELESVRDGARAASERAEEERRGIQTSLSRVEADKSVVEEEFTEEKERLETQLKALRLEYEVAMDTKSQESSTSRSAERDAWSHREKELEGSLGQARALCAEARWQLLSEAALQRQSAASADMSWAEVRSAAARWRALARGHEKDTDMLARNADELERLDSEAESLRSQNRHLMLSLETGQQELQVNVAECRRLQEREDAYEQEVDRVCGQNAALGGHSNHKQKIKHLQAIKEENQSLRQELKKNKLAVVQLENHLRSSQFFEVACDGVSTAAASSGQHTPARPQRKDSSQPTTPSRARAGQLPPRTPGQPRALGLSASTSCLNPGADTAGRPPPAATETLAALGDDRPEAARRERAEALRQARAHRRASERAALEYQHLATMVQHALAAGCLGHRSGGPAPATAPGSGTATPRVSGEAAHCGAADPGALLERLRKLSTAHAAAGGS